MAAGALDGGLPSLPWGTQMLRYRQSSLPRVPVWRRVSCKHLFWNSVAFRMPKCRTKAVRYQTKHRNSTCIKLSWETGEIPEEAVWSYGIKNEIKPAHRPIQGVSWASQTVQGRLQRGSPWRRPCSGGTPGGCWSPPPGPPLWTRLPAAMEAQREQLGQEPRWSVEPLLWKFSTLFQFGKPTVIFYA